MEKDLEVSKGVACEKVEYPTLRFCLEQQLGFGASCMGSPDLFFVINLEPIVYAEKRRESALLWGK